MVNTKTLEKNLSRFGEVEGDLAERIHAMPVREFKKGTILLREGNICVNGFHIVKGTLRVFYIVNGKEITSRFAEEGDACISYWSFYKQEPSFEYIDCIEDCIVTVLSHSDLQQMYDDYPAFNKVMRVGMENSHIKAEERAKIIRSLPATERYMEMRKMYPDVFEKATKEQIATFIGITRESLSRIMSKERQTPQEREDEKEQFLQAVGTAGYPV